MPRSPRPRADREPLGLWAARRREGARSALPFEFSSRGDRVPGRLWHPTPSRGPLALVLRLGSDGCAADGDAAAAAWLECGIAVASIDLPLQGARRSAKLSAQLAAALAAPAPPPAIDLAAELVRQAMRDLRGALDALPSLARIDPRRIALVGVGLGAGLGAHFCAGDPRPRAAVLVDAAGSLPGALDPARALPAIAPRPLLLVASTRGPGDAEALHAAARDPHPLERVDAEPGARAEAAALPAMRAFVARSLGIGRG